MNNGFNVYYFILSDKRKEKISAVAKLNREFGAKEGISGSEAVELIS